MRIAQKLPLFLLPFLILAFSASSAHAAAPWLRLESGSVPGVLQEGAAEVQELKASPGLFFELFKGTYFELKVGGKSVGDFATEEIAALAELTEPTAENIQNALEAEEFYGKGNVVVTGGPAGTAPLIVKNVNKGPVPALEATALGVGTAETKVLTKGSLAGYITATVANLGDADLSGGTTPLAITDTLPAGLTAVTAEGVAGTPGTTLERGPVNCTIKAAQAVSCVFEGTLPPYQTIEVRVGVLLSGAKSGEENHVSVTGGDAPSVEPAAHKIRVGGETPFGVESYEMTAEQEGGTLDTQAGSHPFQLTTTIALNQSEDPRKPPALVKDLRVKLPPGLVGDPTPFPQCTEAQFTKRVEVIDVCPDDTAIGVASVELEEPNVVHHTTVAVPIFNLVPSQGEPARFGFMPYGVPVYLDTSVRTGEDYGVTVSSNNITQLANLILSRLTFWGVPGSAGHDNSRGWSCVDDEGFQKANIEGGADLGPCYPLDQQSPPPLLSMPTSCTGPLNAPLEFDSWGPNRELGTVALNSPMTGLGGCNKLPFEPTIKSAPDLEDASSPSGLSVDVHVPQELQINGNATASEAEVKQIEVALPQGVTLNPGGAGGLQACAEGEVGYEGKELAGEAAMEFLSSTLPEPFCPKQAKIGTVTIHTPLLPNPLEGAVYLADPAPTGEAGQNPYKSLIAMYLVAEDPISGTLVKLPMHVSLNEETGQVVTTVESPQLPFEDAELHFFGGGRAPLATPGLCGAYTTKAVFTPWSGQEPATSTSTFDITSGPNGSPCPSNPKPFTPEFNVGTTNSQAGEYSELRTTMGHPDEDQALGALKMTLPPGVSGMLSHVTLCPEPQAAEGTCGPESLIGHTTVTAGLGSTPAVVARPGNVYITGPYDGAPYGLSIDNPAETGPFDLDKGTRCDCTVVRAKIEISPQTAQITVTTPPTGAQGAIPTMLDGIPLDLQHVSVQIDRPGFTFNPTNCEPLKITGTMSGAEGASFAISEPFQATNCASLAFKPKLAASTSSKTSKADGASLTVKLTYPNTPQGTEANIAKVKVDLPKQLPSRLTTLQKACVAKVFEANPASCPAASIVGHAKAITPILPVPLEGPAYFVSHGGEAFPSLIFVLQGYGVTEDLVGTTFISKAGITSSTFKAVPDVPVGSFELTLPQEPYSALAANLPANARGSFCGQKLALPTAFVAQNGAEIHTSTPLAVTGCKPALGIVSDSVKGTKATIVVSVPAAGRLLASGKGVSTGRGKAAKAGDVRVQVTLTKAEQAFLRKHARRKLTAKINLRFTPSKGAKLTTSVTVLIA